jgi:hypothetical protein
MDVWRTVAVLLRRWYITVPAFVVVLTLAGAAYSLAPLEYQSRAVLVLTTPLSGATEATRSDQPDQLTNPLMNFDRSLALSASIVIQQLNSAETARSLGVTPASATSYTVTNGSTNPELLESGPFIFVAATGPSPKEAQDVAERVASAATELLAARQTELGAPAPTHISIQEVVPATPGQPLLGSPMRAAAAAGGLAALVSLAAVYGFENLMFHRRRRRPLRDAAVERIGSAPVRAPIGRVVSRASSEAT